MPALQLEPGSILTKHEDDPPRQLRVDHDHDQDGNHQVPGCERAVTGHVGSIPVVPVPVPVPVPELKIENYELKIPPTHPIAGFRLRVAGSLTRLPSIVVYKIHASHPLDTTERPNSEEVAM
jgi:hypothetical protein